MIFGTPPIITNGLVLNLDAANMKSYPKSGTTWRDLSGFNNSGSLVNSPTFSSTNGGAIVFDGVDDYVLWNSLEAVKWQNWSSMTIECGFKLNSTTGGNNGRQYLIDFRDSGGIVGAIGLFNDSNITPLGLKLFYTTTTGAYEEPLITTINLNTTYYYQVTFDKTTSTNNIKHFINGVNIFNRSISITANDTVSGRAYLGIYGGGGYQWNGNVYNFKFYNRALSLSEIQQNYNALKSRFNLQ